MNARDQEQYERAWQHHIAELAALALAANVKYDTYRAVKNILHTWLATATDRLYNTGDKHE